MFDTGGVFVHHLASSHDARSVVGILLTVHSTVLYTPFMSVDTLLSDETIVYTYITTECSMYLDVS